ncbi:centrosomal protein of 19 kDa-like [Lineus longissimus]|uniref:centrosomal protein of 19 kDa-like n=1 Tax=Lineus longissimus TaxID=88925 RepID=UPI002B4E0D37
MLFSTMSSPQYKLKKCGIKYNPPSIILDYVVSKSGKLRRRTMPLRNFSKWSSVEQCAKDLRGNPRHARYLENLPQSQLLKMIQLIHDKLNGIALQESLKKSEVLNMVDPDEDLNKVDDDVLKRKKAIMNETFEKNQKKPGDPDFTYEVEVDFPEVAVETSGWDSDDNNSDF